MHNGSLEPPADRLARERAPPAPSTSMATQRPTTIAEYIRAAPREGQAHLRRVHAILERAAPRAQQVIKWGTPFFVEPRFLFAFSAHKAHLSLAPQAAAMEDFHDELGAQMTTRGIVKFRYDEPLPEDLIRRLAEHCVKLVRERDDDSFW
jgi:uncharacterized protein YdhG (YjbR/CyaY superfamily)